MFIMCSRDIERCYMRCLWCAQQPFVTNKIERNNSVLPYMPHDKSFAAWDFGIVADILLEQVASRQYQRESYDEFFKQANLNAKEN